MSKWMSAHTHPVCDVVVCARSGSRLTEGVSEAWCWGQLSSPCHFWTVYSRIMMTYLSRPACCHHCISIRALHVSVSFICSSPSTFDGGRVWSVVLTQLRGIFLLEDAHCHRSCRFWTVYSRIMMTFKQTRLLSSLYLYTSAPCIRFIHLDPGTVYWDMTPPRKKKGILLWRSAPCIRFIHLYLGVNAWRRACLKRGALLKKYLNCLTVLLYTVMYIPFGTKWWLFNFEMAQILFMD